ncbi:MAG: serine/threonine protein kinase [Acidobacteria bacterium]|nr:serine/threonine protein kinase [Acidobacteriota bacterium]
MVDKKEEWEIGASREDPAAPPKPANVDFARSASLVGTHLDGRFFIQKDLTDGGADAGGFGLVYLAKDLKLLGKDVVVKILRKTALANEDIVRKFQHEKEALIRLDHPNIVRILDSGTLADGNPFMVMEFIPGRSLRRKIKETGKFEFGEAAHLIESITDALAAAHSQKILHRDIKPENIMLTPQDDGPDRVRLIDFGIARIEDSVLAPATEIPRGIGTILYIAPEQLLGKMDQTPAGDIYSAAIVFYEMLTGELPFRPESIVEMYQLQQQGVKTSPRTLRSGLNAAAEQLLLSALDFDPAKRPQNVRQFGRDLARALRGITVDNSPAATAHELKATAAVSTPVLAETSLASLASAEVETVDSPERPVGIIADDHYKTLGTSGGSKTRNRAVWPIAALLLILALAVSGGFVAWKYSGQSKTDAVANNSGPAGNGKEKNPAGADKNVTADSVTARELKYFLNVQKMRDNKPFGEPFRSSGQEIFENGYKFRLNIESGAGGFLYAYAEDRDADGRTIYNVLYPTPKANDGSAAVNSGKNSESGWNTFSGTAGTEIVWIIWTAKEDADLETARRSGFSNAGRVSDASLVAKLKSFIEKNDAQKANGAKDAEKQLTVVNGSGDIVLHRIALEHR